VKGRRATSKSEIQLTGSPQLCCGIVVRLRMRTISLVNKSGESLPAQIECKFVSQGGYTEAHQIHLSAEGFEIKGEGPDSFEAFCRVREELERRGWLPHCYGASRNVWPSGMCRNMGGGTVAYRIALGQYAREQDLVGIFDTGPDVEPATVKEQYAFSREWLASFTKAR